MAVARKLAVLIWHLLTKEQDYFWARPALVAAKQRQLALKAGAGRARCPSPRFGLRLQREGVAKQRESRGRECRACLPVDGSVLAATRRSGARTPQRRNDYNGCVAALSSSSTTLCHVVVRAGQI